MKPNNVIYLKIGDDSFYRMWIEFLAPFHKLTSRERDVAARIVAQYFKLRESIPDPEMLREVLWSHTSRKDMRESLGMSQAHFQMILAKLRTSGVLVDGDINPKYIPHIGADPRFMLSIVFDWSSPQKPINNG
jgi:hypothetical protein